ncbi:hypothetical protein BJ875DRAFT_387499 [Amylocarpus encephaloides]|uniref:Uncharacterized protein n=1 Tax=Amylocarpus encephaloides TaxID=45428 RepID=A0A9P7YA93_9HELO|nr:hypothetical protein BJ875DRAFT_387499 [Amylocarpus encephaloides]
MPSLVIPESGMSLGSAGDGSGMGPSTAFAVALSDAVIEDMIKCVQNGKPIQLSLGEHPNFSYGTKTQHLIAMNEPFTHELYRFTTSDADDSAMDFAATFGGKRFKPGPKPAGVMPKHRIIASASATAGTDLALAQLQNSLAAEGQRKAENTTKLVAATIPTPRKGAKPTSKSKFLANKSLATTSVRSMPTSPALSGVGSPALGPTSVPLSIQKSDRDKEARKPIIHLLAMGPMTKQELKVALPDISNNELQIVLAKVGDPMAGDKFDLVKRLWKELDVWTYKYDTQEDRQLAIENAITRYDRQRMSVIEPEWERLLPKSERGTGKCLSRLQGNIAAGTARDTPTITLQGDDGSGRDTPHGEEDDSRGSKALSKVKGESMARSNSQPPNSKPKKPTEREAQAKRLLSNKPPKTTSKPTPAPKKDRPVKEKTPAKEKPGKATNTKALSSEFVGDSDEEEEPPAHKPTPKPATIKKRPRDEELETSDSSVPLSKKTKKDVPTPHRASNASQSSHATSNSTYSSGFTKKDTSPQKSSPLASSPPTNASEFENTPGNRAATSSSASPALNINIKGARSPIHKRHHKSSSVTSSTSSNSSTRYLKADVVDVARKYRTFYPTYEALHRELAGMRHRDKEKEHRLLEMHERLAEMKRRITAGIVEIS